MQKRLFEVMSRASKYYERNLESNEEARDYLDSRGIQPKTVKRYSLGFALPDWQNISGVQTFDPDLLEGCGLTKRGSGGRIYDRFRSRIMFPIRDVKGRVMGFGGRILPNEEESDGEQVKYLNSPSTEIYSKGESLHGLYEFLNNVPQGSQVVLVEGYLHAIALTQAGIPAIAALGTAFTKRQLQQSFRWWKQIVCCFDGDRAGRAAAWRAVEIAFSCIGPGTEMKILPLPPGFDPDDFVRTRGGEAFEQAMNQAQGVGEFFCDELTSNTDLTNPDVRVRVVERAQPIVGAIQYAPYRQAIESRLRELTGIDVASVKSSPARQERQKGGRRRRSKIPRDVRLVTYILRHVPVCHELDEALVQKLRPWKDSSPPVNMVMRIRDDGLQNASEVVGSYSGSRLGEFLAEASLTSGPSGSSVTAKEEIARALRKLDLRLSAEARKDRVHSSEEPDAIEQYGTLYPQKSTES